MENHSGPIESLVEKAHEYGQSNFELFRLKAIDKSADVLSSATAKLAVTLVFTLSFLILNIGIALWIGDAIGKNYFGFFIVAGFYLLVGIIFYAFRNKWVKTPVRNSIILKALK